MLHVKYDNFPKLAPKSMIPALEYIFYLKIKNKSNHLIDIIILFFSAFRAGWRNSHPKFRNQKESRGRKNPALENFLLFINKTPCFQTICWLSCNIGQFLSVWGNFLLPIRADNFLNGVLSENLELGHGISQIFPVFGKVIVYLSKMIVDLKKYQLWKSTYSGD